MTMMNYEHPDKANPEVIAVLQFFELFFNNIGECADEVRVELYKETSKKGMLDSLFSVNFGRFLRGKRWKDKAVSYDNLRIAVNMLYNLTAEFVGAIEVDEILNASLNALAKKDPASAKLCKQML